MSKFVKGSYLTIEEARIAVDEVASEGYDRNLITLVTNRETADTLPNDLDVGVSTEHSEKNEEEDESFIDKVKHLFSSDDDTDDQTIDSTDEGYEADEAVLIEYKDEISNGSIVVLVDDFGLEPGAQDFENSTPSGKAETSNTVPPSDSIDTADTLDTIDTTDYSTLDATTEDPSLTDDERIQLKEERLDVDTTEVQTGEVTINKTVDEETKTVDVPVKHEEVTIERHPVTDSTPVEESLELDEKTIVIPVTEEQIDVTKRSVVTDEVTINKDTKEDVKEVTDTVRKENLDVQTHGDVRVEDEDDTTPL
ncbi:putative stress response protein [Carnobacterium sp. 17-4]|uniref:YsnF/AvaK domain-containing protein n=1 Tax=Carnobacterium sp. (strain 17-4) TaxID=208596 RepID=UPI0002058D0D|nr:YsnF/AvaK domain-containing protein [Carnobacterium sp. 17-4]AEB30734.1 putative stress response protein [Carnobacterium sp. 17-4]